MVPFPLSTMVLNVTNQCNLACTYCYEYGEDKIVDTAHGKQSKFMTEATARESVEFLLREAGHIAHLTFFGGETLLNFPVLKSTVAYARRRAAEDGQDRGLQPDDQRHAAAAGDHRVSRRERDWRDGLDGRPERAAEQVPRVSQRRGSYDIVAPKIKELLQRHRSRPIGARVTLTSETLDVTRIYRHLTEEFGFWEVGFAPVTTSPSQRYAIWRPRIRSDARPVPRAGARVPGARGREPASRLLEHQGHARGDSQGREQGVSVRRRPWADGRFDRWRCGRLPPLCRAATLTSSAP